jgi:FlaA1/EpsC-like NDP-sugar epimerase
MVENLIRNTPQIVIRYRSWLNAVFQAGLILVSLSLAWLLRFDFQLPYPLLLFSVAPILILVRLAAITYFGLLHGWWRYTGVSDTIDILKAVITGSVAFWVLLRYLLGVTSFPRSIYFLEALVTAFLLAGVRLGSRLLVESVRRNVSDSKRVILIGAGFAAQMIIRETIRPGSGYTPVACVDDDPSKLGIKLHGVPVVGHVGQLPSLLSSYAADEVLITVPSATSTQMRRFVQVCEGVGVPFKTVPALRDVIAGEVSVRQLREVDLDDLLAREPAQIDLEAVREQIEGNSVMVTGAAGSIGSEICRQILDYGAARLVCVDQNETGLFHLRLEHQRHRYRDRGIYRVADVRDRTHLREIFTEHTPNVIFHAAAYKHVPMMEMNVREVVENNVFALVGLLEEAQEGDCKSFVLISSDKAVNPTSAMGVTKRVCELIVSARPSNGMRCVSVRFGNVLGSSGSVVPILKEQIHNNRPLTITHPEVKRFFMTIREAVALVLQAFVIGGHSDILVLEMGEQVRILDLALALVRLSGRSEKDVQFDFIGLRDGEKLEEELFYPDEQLHATLSRQIKRTRGASDGWEKLQRQLRELRAAMSINGPEPIRRKLKEIVPQYTYPGADQPIEAGVSVGALVVRRAVGHHS